MLAPGGVVRDDEPAGVGGVGDRGQDLDGDIWHRGDRAELAQLGGHDGGSADEAVQRHLVDHETGGGRDVAQDDPALAFHAGAQAAGDGFFAGAG